MASQTLEKPFGLVRAERAIDRPLQFLKLGFSLNLNDSLLEARHDTHSASKLWSGRRESNPRPTAWKAVTLPLSYSRPRFAFPEFEVPRFARDLGGGLKRPPNASTWKAVTLPLSYSRPSCRSLDSARDFGCGLPLRSRPQNASSYSRPKTSY